MPLNDLVKDYSITTIAQKTNIPVEILEKLVNKEWESLQLAKSKGFIAIIEREFNVDLSELKDEASEYYASHKKEDVFRPIDLVDAQSVGGGAGKIVTNIVALLTIALVAYAGWFYFVKPKSNSVSQSESNSSGLIKESINAAKNLVGIQDTPKESSKSTDNDSKKEEATKVVEEKNRTSAPLAENKKVEEQKKFDITTDVKESNSSVAIDNNSSNKVVETLALSTNSTKSVEANGTLNLDKEANKSIKEDVETLLEENKTTQEEKLSEQNSTLLAEEKIEDTNITLASEDNSSSNTIATKVTIKPNVKAIWVGVYNLESGKRVAKVVNGSFDFDTDGADLAIVTGHSKFEISTDSGLDKKFDGRGRKYLYINKDEIKELTKLEYKALTKKRAW